MRVLEGSPQGWEPGGATALAVGVFDGVHRGHLAIVAMARRAAEDHGLIHAVLTFDPNPRSVVDPGGAPGRLGTLGQRLERLAAAGVELTAVLHFDERIRRLTAAEFASDIIVGALGATVVVVGEDFRFGRGRQAGVDDLDWLGRSLGFSLIAVPLVGDDDPVSSSRVRHLVTRGEVEAAAHLLGRRYELEGLVVPGAGRGRAIGVPTANLLPADDVVIPGRGVYAVMVEHEGEWHQGVANVGVRPTFGGDDAEVVEVHVLHGEPDLHAARLVLRFVTKLRDERRFDSVDDLVAQIRRDIVAAGEELAAHTS